MWPAARGERRGAEHLFSDHGYSTVHMLFTIESKPRSIILEKSSESINDWQARRSQPHHSAEDCIPKAQNCSTLIYFDEALNLHSMTVSEQLINISHPTCHDVLSGRGNIANRHVGNEHFRSLVKKYKTDYVACAKSSKPLYSKLIYDEIRSMSPPGRFLKQDPTTKLWNDIGKKAALAKTRQALREGAPELLMDIQTAEHVRQTLVQDFSQATIFTDSPSTATVSDYFPRSESNASFTSGNLLSLVPTNNSKFQFSGSVAHTQGSDCLHVEPPSLDSNITSSHHDAGSQFQPVNQSIDWQQLPIVPTMSSCNMPSVSQTDKCKHEHNMNADVAFDQQTCNATSNALIALIDSMKSSNETIDQNVSQAGQTIASPALGTLLQQLQSQIACQQLLTQLGLSQST